MNLAELKSIINWEDKMATKKGEVIKDQGFVPYAKQKKMATSKGPKPGAGKGKSRGGGIAKRGTNFTGIF